MRLFFAAATSLDDCGRLRDVQDKASDQACGHSRMMVMDASFRLEAYDTAAARDARIGRASQYLEFVAASPEHLKGLDLYGVAIGPALNEPGFEKVATAVASEILDVDDPEAQARFDIRLSVARVNYVFKYRDGIGSKPSVTWSRHSLKSAEDQHGKHIQTALWLEGFIAGHLSRRSGN